MDNEMDERKSAESRAAELCAAGKHPQATFYFINALARSPGDMDLIGAFSNSVLVMAKQAANGGDGAEALRQLDWLESFLKERVAFVSPNAIERVLELSQSAAASKQDLERRTPGQETEVSLVAAEWEALCSGAGYDVEGKGALVLEERIGRLEEVREYAIAFGRAAPDADTIRQLDCLIATLRAALEFDALAAQFDALVALGENEQIPTAAAYCFQLCEGLVRQLVLLKQHVDPARKGRCQVILETLRMTSERVAAASREADSAAQWERFQTETQGELSVARQWTPSTGAAQDASCQQQLELLRSLSRRSQALIAKLSDEATSKKAVALLDELGELARKASVAQQRKYNEWTMARIRAGFKAGLECLSVVSDDEEKLGDELTKHLGSIDTRHLTSEVSRCYNEVFEHLYAALTGPKNERDFDERGRKLKVLKDFFERKKAEPSEF